MAHATQAAHRHMHDYEGHVAAVESDLEYWRTKRLEPRLLDRIRFPLGEQTKAETRAEAERAGLAVASRGESQEACFLGGGDYREFLERHIDAGADRSDRDGKRLEASSRPAWPQQGQQAQDARLDPART